MKRPNPTTPLPLTLQLGGRIQTLPSLSTSKSKLGRTFEGGDCKAAGPANAFPVKGSYNFRDKDILLFFFLHLASISINTTNVNKPYYRP